MNFDEKRNIGLFFDGYYFWKIYEYYLTCKTVFSIDKFKEFILYEVSNYLKISQGQCEINDVHYFIGGIATNHEEKMLEKALINAGLGSNIHRSSLRSANGGGFKEKGVDVSLALKAQRDALDKKYDVLILITGDSDFVPLVDEIKALGIPVVGVCWDNQDTNTRAHDNFIASVDHLLMMNERLQSRANKNPFRDLLFEPLEVSKNSSVADLRQIETATFKTRPIDTTFSTATKLRAPTRTNQPKPVSSVSTQTMVENSGSIPCLLTSEERSMEYESVILKRDPTTNYGFIKSKQKYDNWRWNNYHFFVNEVRNRQQEEVVEGQRVKFYLENDRRRSEENSVPLYKAVNITVLE